MTATRAGLEARTASTDADVWLVLLTLTCPDFDIADVPDDTLRFVANEEAVVSRGHTYHAWGFDYVAPAQGLSGAPARLRMDNVDRRITEAVKLLPADARIDCRVEVVLSGDPDHVEEDSPPFQMTAVEFDKMSITGTLGLADDSREALSGFAYGRAVTPGLHA